MPLGKRLAAGLILISLASAANVRRNRADGQLYAWVPPGQFRMGCSPGDSECGDNEKPVRTVRITRGFWMGRTEVTVAAYRRFVRATSGAMPAEGPAIPQDKLSANWRDKNLPVIAVSWNHAKAFCDWAKARLPTEAEWEYAARAGSTGARYGELDRIAWYAGNSGRRPLDAWNTWESRASGNRDRYLGILASNGNRPRRVAGRQPNSWGLHDMLGNVWEWTADWYQPSHHPVAVAVDPAGPHTGSARAVRGGSWDYFPSVVRASFRGRYEPDNRNLYIGFRCAAESLP